MSGAAPEPDAGAHHRAPELAGIPRVDLLECAWVPGAPNARGAPGSLLLLHGFGDDGTALRGIGDALCPAGTLAVYPTLRAHGGSPFPEWGYSPLDFAADIHRIADAFPRPVHVVGHSYGALIAAISAVMLGPDRIGSVALLDQSFEPFEDRYEADEWAEASFLKWHYDYTHLFDSLTALGIPVLTVIARESPVVPAEERERMLARRGDKFSCVLAGGTHKGFLQRSAAEILRDFYGHHFPKAPPLETCT
ncbi:alpha/beta fold hydrolase [Streptomyces sp. NPDC002055]|uniref:alpha/beta fold hydrolase n=1 Tax=Streptomyces sp. NPDC002055 TaxID=3154534 RepID=UPI003334505F